MITENKENKAQNKTASFASRLGMALLERGVKAAELSRKSGISEGSISRYLSGAVVPRMPVILLLAQALDVSDDWLLGFDVEMKREDPFDQGDRLNQLLKRQEAQRTAENEPAVQCGGLSTTEAGLLEAFRKLSLADQVKVISLCLELTGGSQS